MENNNKQVGELIEAYVDNTTKSTFRLIKSINKDWKLWERQIK